MKGNGGKEGAPKTMVEGTIEYMVKQRKTPFNFAVYTAHRDAERQKLYRLKVHMMNVLLQTMQMFTAVESQFTKGTDPQTQRLLSGMIQSDGINASKVSQQLREKVALQFDKFQFGTDQPSLDSNYRLINSYGKQTVNGLTDSSFHTTLLGPRVIKAARADPANRELLELLGKYLPSE